MDSNDGNLIMLSAVAPHFCEICGRLQTEYPDYVQ